jgi:hypothetical protein
LVTFRSVTPIGLDWRVFIMVRHVFLLRANIALGVGVLVAFGLAVGSATGATAAEGDGGPVDLGTSATYGVLGASAVTNTGPTVVHGNIGVSPGTSITGFSVGNGIYTGARHLNDEAAATAQNDVTVAFNAAADLTPTTLDSDELNGRSLTPGVYAGGELQLATGGLLTLAGSAESVWVFQAASTLVIGSGSDIEITGGASSCNVFWQVGSSATLGTSAKFKGTILASQSITAETGATIEGRLLAQVGAVTLDSNVITRDSRCASDDSSGGDVVITSEAPHGATAGTPYSYAVTATGTPSLSYVITSGSLPEGLNLDSKTGTISGTPTTAGTSTFTVRADNGVGAEASATYTIETAPAIGSGAPGTPSAPGVSAPGTAAGDVTTALANTGNDGAMPLTAAVALMVAGVALVLRNRLFTQRKKHVTRS